MYKLLIPEKREEVAREYARRRLAVMLMLLAFALAISIFAVLPALIQAKYKQGAAKIMLESAEKSSRTSDRAELESWAAVTKGKLATLSIPAGGKPYDDFKAVLDKKIPGIKINGLNWVERSGEKVLEVRGIATDRQTLIAFQSALKDSGAWESAELPVGALAKDVDIDFSLTLKRH